MVATFTKDKHGWRCVRVFQSVTQDMAVDNFAPICIYVNVTRAPRLGFCKRPHHYL